MQEKHKGEVKKEKKYLYVRPPYVPAAVYVATFHLYDFILCETCNSHGV